MHALLSTQVEGGVGAEGTFEAFWAALNAGLDRVGLELRRCVYPGDGARYVGVVNKQEDDAAKLATCFTPVQLAFFRALVYRLARDTDAARAGMSEADAHNIEAVDDDNEGGATAVAALAKMKAVEREETLAELVSQGWLAERGKRYHLGVRSFLELRSSFLDSIAPQEIQEFWDRRA